MGDPTRLEPPPVAKLPPRIGKYKILETLGEGGMGVVCLAYQTEPVRRRVALKLIKLGMGTKQVIARFESERQALAVMNHPNVAKVFDAGVTQDGRSYFVMEYVPGIPITQYCNTHRLGVEARLRLFMKVCEAIQHAHQNSIIHRDIKSSNVLVSAEGDKPIPKVIDFGVARAVKQPLTESTLFTEHGQLIGTPEYMSPEQAEMSGLEVDTRTDIYSLGVLLYELMTGSLPIQPGRLRRLALEEIRRQIREEDPPKPSTRLTTQADHTALVASQRHTDPKSLLRELRGDLDWITMKAMEKDRTRRYPTASELAADIRRHLRHEPVLAGPPSTAYRMKKFIRRHQVGVGAGLAVGISLILGIAGITTMAVIASQQRTGALKAKADTEAINAFLSDMLKSADPSQSGRDVKVAEVLGKAAAKVDSDFASRPEIKAALHDTIGTTYWTLGLYEEAEAQLESGVDIRRRVLGPEHADTLDSQNSLAVILKYQGRLADAEPLYRRTLEAMRRTLGIEDRATLSSINNLAVLLRNLDKLDEAETLHREALGTLRRVLGPEDPDTLNSMSNLALTLRDQDKLDEAERLARESLETRRRVQDEEHPSTLQAMNALAAVLASRGELVEAERLDRRTLETAHRVFGPKHLYTLVSMNSLAGVYSQQDRDGEARPLYEAAVEGARGTLPYLHWRTGEFLDGYGACLTRLKRYDVGEAALLEAHEILNQRLGTRHRLTINAIRHLITLYEDLGDADKAAAWQAKQPVAEPPTKRQSQDQ